ncbi:DUF4424 domain-containing protein [Aurantimonas sp. 22II-16-19i]|uniref:DUF4424 domain-containing protein n=1 Tax=Aurantimonas sp. 22II-16-19i TaxID=1317114 RepID=UPI0009F7AA93|nr:DUF4424 domain-containing protein [Aurantimonas sp. 22II-16-19i]ORE93771.1 hypothetical protein ATO4_15311 [Aurantimonas sp. 22II-16-19i]
MPFRGFFSALLLFVCAGPALANDSTANFAAGGLVLTKTDAIEMRREDLAISLERISVDYEFVNVTDQPVTTTVAFPLPEIAIDPFNGNVDLPSDNPDDPFLFETMVDGKPVEMTIDRAAYHDGENVSNRLAELGVPLAPFAGNVVDALDALPEAEQQALVADEIAVVNEYDAGKGWERHLAPNWSIRLAYHWDQTFPPGRTVRVSHSYKPSVGSFVSTEVGASYQSPEEARQFRARYCVEDDIIAAVKRAGAKAGFEGGGYQDRYIDYVLTTGANWAKPIGTFRLVVDKGAAKNLVSFCASGVKKIAPTKFEVVYQDFVPKEDLHVLILVAPTEE